MITERLLKEIIQEINLQADDALVLCQGTMENSPNRSIYEQGKEIGLRRAVSIIRKHQLRANPK